MNGQDPNQNLNNITPGGVDASGQTPVQSPVVDSNVATPVTQPVPDVMATPAPEMVPDATQTVAPVMPDPASVMPQVPAAPVADQLEVPVVDSASDANVMAAPAPETVPEATQTAVPVMPDPASVMPQAPAEPVANQVVAPATQPVPDANVMATPASETVPDATQTAAQTASVTTDSTAQTQVPTATLADPKVETPEAAGGEEKPAKKGIAIDKNVIIIIVGIVIIIVVLLVAWKSGLIFSGKKTVTPSAASGNVAEENNTTPVEPDNKPQNTKEAEQKMNDMPWFLELVQMRYSELGSGKDILEDTDNMLFIAYEIYKEAKSTSGDIIANSSCNIDAEALEVNEVNKLLNNVFDDEIVNKNLTNSTYKIYTKEEYDKLKSNMACSSAKTCNDSKNCKVTDSYVLFETNNSSRENVAKYEDLSYADKELTGKLVLSYNKDTKEGIFTIKFDDDNLIKSIEIKK